MQPSFSLLAAPSDLLSSDPRHDRSPAPLLPLILGTLFSAFLLSLPAFLFLGHCGMWENAETLWQFLLFALFFSPSEEGQMQHFPDGYRQSSFVSGEICRVFCLRLVPHVAGLRESLELGATTGENLP